MNVWSLDAANPGAQLPLQTRCGSDSEHCSDRHGQSSTRCTDLGDDDKRTLIDPDIVRDVVIGLSDGLTVPFALTAGLSSLGESRLVILGGIAELIAGAISMGIGGFLASQAERDHYQFLKRRISARVQRSCDDEIEREVYAILGPAGIDKHIAQAVTSCLRRGKMIPGSPRSYSNLAKDSVRSDDVTYLP
ncbi:VIT family-domain-containing protein [Pisolithus marmoratus]|nr:VIT family-domain-containing protein [Pisolithus marmoratus]